MSDTYRLTIAVRKRTDLDAPSSEQEAITLVHNLLLQGSLIDVLAVTPEAKHDDKKVKWG